MASVLVTLCVAGAVRKGSLAPVTEGVCIRAFYTVCEGRDWGGGGMPRSLNTPYRRHRTKERKNVGRFCASWFNSEQYF